MTTNSEGPIKDLIIVYAGIRLDDKNKRHFLEYHLDDDYNVIGHSYWTKLRKGWGRPKVGQIWRFRIQGNSYFSAGEHRPIWLNTFPNHDKIIEWSVEDKKSQTILNEKKAMRELPEPLEDITLGEFKQIYLHSSYRNRQAYLAAILEIIGI